MATVRDIIDKKGHVVHSIDEGKSVFEAIAQMVDRNVGSLVVTNDQGLPVGILTERDYLRRVALEGRSSRTTRVDEIMSSQPVLVELDATAEDCMRLMTRYRIRHLPVVGEGVSLGGLLSMGDIVQYLASERESEVKELQSYINGCSA
jgi:CBS domain-containing protein